MQEKIVTTALFVRTLVKGFQVVHPILIVVNVALVQSWERELHLWASDVNVVNYASKNEEKSSGEWSLTLTLDYSNQRWFLPLLKSSIM